jgi:hypothetical protein
MKKQNLFLFLLIVLSNAMLTEAIGQQTQPEAVFIRNRQGDQFFNKTAIKWEGSPFYPYEYCVANIKTSGGQKFAKTKVRLGLIDNLVYYMVNDSSELVVNMPVEKIEFSSCTEGVKGGGTEFQSGFAAIDKQDEKTFYQVLDSGKIKLLKYRSVTFSDDQAYGSTTTTRTFKTTETFYANLPGNKMVKLGKGKEAILSVLADKKSQVENYIATNELKCKTEDDLVYVFNYYNSL